MATRFPDVSAIVFDYGNTLIQFGLRETAICDAALADALARIYGAVDLERVRAVRDRNRMAIYAGDPPPYRENDLRVITRDLVRHVYGVEPTSEEIERLVQVRFDVFIEVTEAPDGVAALLDRLRTRYPLALLSNYPDSKAILTSLRKVGFAPFFDHVVISADLGFVKPHPIMFESVAQALDVQPAKILLVGDNWLADVQGGKRAGMRVAQTLQWAPYETFDRQPGDAEPDLVLQRLSELESYV